MSHFLLELQEANRTVIIVGFDDPLQLSTDPWDDSEPSFISSIGGFVIADVLASHDGDSD